MKILFALLTTILLTNCAGNQMKPTDFKDQKPRLIIEDYLSGNIKAWGLLQDRSGKVTRQFSANLNGKWDGKQLILDEKFNWSDGEVQTRQWQITKIDEHNYEGTAGDVVGKAKGYSYGPAFKFDYVLLVPVKGKEIKDFIRHLPKKSNFYFTTLKIERSMGIKEIKSNLGEIINFDEDPRRAYSKIKTEASKDDLILVTGSNYIAKEIFNEN